MSLSASGGVHLWSMNPFLPAYAAARSQGTDNETGSPWLASTWGQRPGQQAVLADVAPEPGIPASAPWRVRQVQHAVKAFQPHRVECARIEVPARFARARRSRHPANDCVTLCCLVQHHRRTDHPSRATDQDFNSSQHHERRRHEFIRHSSIYNYQHQYAFTGANRSSSKQHGVIQLSHLLPHKG